MTEDQEDLMSVVLAAILRKYPDYHIFLTPDEF